MTIQRELWEGFLAFWEGHAEAVGQHGHKYRTPDEFFDLVGGLVGFGGDTVRRGKAFCHALHNNRVRVAGSICDP